MKTIIVGAVESTKVTFDKMIEHDLYPSLVITVPKEKSHIHSDYVDMESLARSNNIDVICELNVNKEHVLEKVRSIGPHVIFVVGWSRICGPDFMALAQMGVIGYHPAPLPKLRGRAALAWTIILGLKETAGSVFWMDEGTDSGHIAEQEFFELHDRIDLPQLIVKHSAALATMLDRLLPKLTDGQKACTPQDQSAATYLAVRRPADSEIDWRDNSVGIDRLVRSVTRPYPGAFTWLDGRKIYIWEVVPVSYPEWHALEGQVFLYDGDMPVVRCGEKTDLKILNYSAEKEGSKPLSGQVRFR